MMLRQRWAQQGLRVVGVVCVVFSLLFVAWKMYTTPMWILAHVNPLQLSMALSVGAFVYGLNSLWLSAAWGRWLVCFGEDEQVTCQHHAIYAQSQIAKYMPGNIFHVVNRHVLGIRAGIRHASLAASAVCEIIGLLLAAGAMTLAGAGVLRPSQINIPLLATIVIPGLLLALLLTPSLVRYAMAKSGMAARYTLPPHSLKETATRLGIILLYYIAFFAITGCLAVLVMHVFSPSISIRSTAVLFSVFALSWVAGCIMPGAPAGAGVREATMIMALEPFFGDHQSLAFALSFRIMTTVGDVLFFLGSLALPRLMVAYSPQKK